MFKERQGVFEGLTRSCSGLLSVSHQNRSPTRSETLASDHPSGDSPDCSNAETQA